MLLTIDPNSETAIYQQLCDQIMLGIAKGELAVGDLLPSVRQLADELGVNMMTISKAYNLLKDQGYLVTDRRHGTKVLDPPPFSTETKQTYQTELALILAKASLHGRSNEQIFADVAETLTEFKESRDH